MPVSNVFNDDCMNALRLMPDKCMDLAIVDPPYGIKEHGGKNRSGFAKQANGSKIFVKDPGYTKKDWDNVAPTEDYFDELKRVSLHQIIWGVNNYPYYFGRGTIIWDKMNDGSDQNSCELAHYSGHNRIDIFRYVWRGMLQGRSETEGHLTKGDGKKNERRIHPTQKPVALYSWLLKNYAKPGDKILDTHLGSGSSRIAAWKLGFDFWGYELDFEYFAAQEQRFAKEQGAFFDKAGNQIAKQPTLFST